MAVKLGIPRQGGFPRTTELIQGIDYLIRQGLQLKMPLALNLSFGNNYGSHSGESLIEVYLDSVSDVGRNVICVGTGNEGGEALHTSGILENSRETSVQLNIGEYETGGQCPIMEAVYRSGGDSSDPSGWKPGGAFSGSAGASEIFGGKHGNSDLLRGAWPINRYTYSLYRVDPQRPVCGQRNLEDPSASSKDRRGKL